MERKGLFALLALFLLMGGIVTFIIIRQQLYPTSTATIHNTQTSTTTQHYVEFSMVGQEFWYNDEAIATMNHLIDLHEHYSIPVDVILDDAVVQVYEENAPELLERIKNSPMVSVNYHIRPPFPYAQRFDFEDLGLLSNTALHDTLLRYEEHATDMVTGQTLDKPGGYQHLKDLMGYAPIMVGLITEPQFAKTMANIYKDKGASYLIQHRDQPIPVGETAFGLPVRPEDLPIIFFEHATETPEQLIAQTFADYNKTGPVFMSLKTHDNDFFATRSAWSSIYNFQGQHGIPQPPFDLNVHDDHSQLLSSSDQAQRWQIYEAAVKYVAEHPTDYTAINSKLLQTILSSIAIPTTNQNIVTSNGSSTNEKPIYVTVVTHNEEPASGRYPDFVHDEDAFWEHRAALLKFAQLVHTAGAKYDWQSDWNFLQAVQLYDHGTTDTNGKNVVQYLHDDLGVEIDAHAHERNYNYADVNYLIQQLGVEPTGVVGGYIVNPASSSKLEYLWEPIISTINPTYQWQAAILWGGGSPNHATDDNASGIWRPQDNDHFLIHDASAPLPNVGSYTGTWEGLDELLAKQAAGELQSDAMYTASIMMFQIEMLDSSAVTEFQNQLTQHAAAVDAGRIVWVTLTEAKNIWENTYHSQPTIYQAEANTSQDPLQRTKAEQTPPTTGNRTGNKGSCGDGTCDPIELKTGLCSQDCN